MPERFEYFVPGDHWQDGFGSLNPRVRNLLNAARDKAASRHNLSVAAPLEMHGRAITLNLPPAPFRAKITAGPAPFSWAEVDENMAVLSGGRTGTSNAWEANHRPVEVGTVVRLVPSKGLANDFRFQRIRRGVEEPPVPTVEFCCSAVPTTLYMTVSPECQVRAQPRGMIIYDSTIVYQDVPSRFANMSTLGLTSNNRVADASGKAFLSNEFFTEPDAVDMPFRYWLICRGYDPPAQQKAFEIIRIYEHALGPNVGGPGWRYSGLTWGMSPGDPASVGNTCSPFAMTNVTIWQADSNYPINTDCQVSLLG